MSQAEAIPESVIFALFSNNQWYSTLDNAFLALGALL